MGIDPVSTMERACKRIAELEVERDRLLPDNVAKTEASKRLLNELKPWLENCEAGMRELYGNTNYVILRDKASDMAAALTTPATADALERVRREATDATDR